jgi:hypothetical protein
VSGSGLGVADPGNTQDNVVLSYSDGYLGAPFHPDPSVVQEPMADLAGLATNIAHEVAHSFGLRHTGRIDSTTFSLSGGDVMSHHRQAGAGFVRFPLLVSQDSWSYVPPIQNGYQVLADTLGLRPCDPAYVTGAGAHDKITITENGLGTAQVTVAAYSDPSYTPGAFIASTSYTINTAHGVFVNGFGGDDYISVNIGNRPATILGSNGNDTLVGGDGSDILIGGPGDDQLFGGLGNDTYKFERVIEWDWTNQEYFRLGHDTIKDLGGSDTWISLSSAEASRSTWRRPARNGSTRLHRFWQR